MAKHKFIDLLESKTAKSKAIWEEAKKTLPGGVAGSAAFLSPHPIYIQKAVGGTFVDVDGNEYIDLVMGACANILGHSPEPIMEAVRKQLDSGTHFMLFQQTGIKLAQKIQKHMPHMERVRFCNSGSEATMSAIRVARAWTKKDKIAKPEGGYSGQHDYVLVSGTSGRTAGTDDRPIPAADCAGIPQFILDNTVVLPWNNIDATVSIIKEHADELAAVLVEPMQGFGMGDVPADKDYLEALRKVTTENNILLIYDEIVTGFRMGGLGGGAAYYGVTPDLTCCGKVIGGGFPVGAYGGRADIMEQTVNPGADPNKKVFQSGTFTGNPIAMTAGLACLTELENKDFSYIDNLGEKLRNGIGKIGRDHGFEIQMTGVGSVFYPHFNSQPVRTMRDKIKDDVEKNREFCTGMIAHGVYLPPVHPAATCFSHTEDDVVQVLSVAEKVFREMKG